MGKLEKGLVIEAETPVFLIFLLSVIASRAFSYCIFGVVMFGSIELLRIFETLSSATDCLSLCVFWSIALIRSVFLQLLLTLTMLFITPYTWDSLVNSCSSARLTSVEG